MGDVQFVDYNGYTNQNRHQMLVEQIQNGKHETVWPPFPYMQIAVTPLCRHPSSVHGDDA